MKPFLPVALDCVPWMQARAAPPINFPDHICIFQNDIGFPVEPLEPGNGGD